jgi:hypothetical protein
MKTILALDISMRSTGVVLLMVEEDGSYHPPLCTTWKTALPMDHMDAAFDQAAKLSDLLEQAKPDLVLVEGYSLGSSHGAESLISVGAILRAFLRIDGYKWTTVAPQTLKKFAGASLKEDIKVEAFKRWGFEHSSNDVVDAFVMAQIGAALLQRPVKPLTKAQLEVCEGLINPKPAKKKAKK